MACIQVVIWLFVVQCSAVCFANYVLKEEPEYKHTLLKRILMEENFESLESKINNLTQRVEALEKENALLKHAPVAFLAELTKSVTSQNQIILFDSVKLNLGNAYFNVHGNFIAPVSGLYQFSVTACAATNHYIVLELIVNARVVGKVLTGDTGYNECSSNSFLVQLSTGDDVYVQHKTAGDYLLANPAAGFPTFSGVLLNVI
ncbi:heavy metal-binding protein HIP-like [Mytilus trossulus]|uniref:heavy metal-binding protein HIP-like n=1 Tax=Mytilus trossulus TaxID=6551 RepID=UPI00300795DA